MWGPLLLTQRQAKILHVQGMLDETDPLIDEDKLRAAYASLKLSPLFLMMH